MLDGRWRELSLRELGADEVSAFCGPSLGEAFEVSALCGLRWDVAVRATSVEVADREGFGPDGDDRHQVPSVHSTIGHFADRGQAVARRRTGFVISRPCLGGLFHSCVSLDRAPKRFCEKNFSIPAALGAVALSCGIALIVF
jgi:hypothetical protein